ncbi:hypothetical protein [Mesorhizobium sp. L-2-11]|uniref:hypothetical protein n=1 Tax=Mesorhizobium sp. L-2-11 TaxID=2744521 RepID=UPI0018EBC6DD|nr:hypothetical protein [Mesorhizobium sp. L-2-11]
MSETLPALVDRAAQTLASARTAAEILDARDKAAMVYDMAKRAGRLAAARNAYDELIPAIHRAQADALISRKAIHEARIIRDAEVVKPGVVRATVDEALAAGKEPTKAKVRQAVEAVAPPRGQAKAKPAPTNGNAERIEMQRVKAQIWRDLRTGLEALASLPAAADVADIVAGTNQARPIVERRLPQALAFLKEFSDAWNA